MAFWSLLAAGAVFAENPPRADATTGERTPLQTVVPIYPERARRDRLEGEVQVCFDVDREGRPYRIAVRRSTHRVFERPAIDAVRASSYAPVPAREPVPAMKTCRSFSFTLEAAQDESASASTRSAASRSVVPILTMPSSWPAMTAIPVEGKSDSHQSRSNSRAMSGVP